MEEKRPKRFNKIDVRNIAISFVGSLLVVLSIENALFDKTLLVRMLLLIAGISVLAYSLLPLIMAFFVYRTWHVLGRFEQRIKQSLLREYKGSHLFGTLFGETTHAATAYVLSPDKTHILLILHPFFNFFMPPGGRLLVNEKPHSAVIDRVCTETGLPRDSLVFCSTCCPVHKTHINPAQPKGICPHEIPWVIQSEVNEQRGGIPYHHDFIYVLASNTMSPLKGDNHPQWFNQKMLEDLQDEQKPFDNVMSLAKEVWQLCQQCKANNKECNK